jgi:hypothetical protein
LRLKKRRARCASRDLKRRLISRSLGPLCSTGCVGVSCVPACLATFSF